MSKIFKVIIILLLPLMILIGISRRAVNSQKSGFFKETVEYFQTFPAAEINDNFKLTMATLEAGFSWESVASEHFWETIGNVLQKIGQIIGAMGKLLYDTAYIIIKVTWWLLGYPIYLI